MEFEEYFKKRNPNYEFLINRMRCAFDVDEIKYCHINSVNLRIFKDYMHGEVSNSSLKNYMAIVSATVNTLADDGLCRKIDFKSLNRIKCEKSENIALTEDELDMFVNYYKRIKNQNTIERDILTLFLLECFTGARTSDCELFTKDDILNGFLTYVSIKTHTLTRLPVHKMLPILLERMPSKEYSRMTKCRKIKEIAKNLGINRQEKRMYRGELKTRPRYEYIATHTARRTFVSLMLDKGVPLATVSKLAGHSDTSMTLRYYCSDDLVLNKEAMSFFND